MNNIIMKAIAICYLFFCIIFCAPVFAQSGIEFSIDRNENLIEISFAQEDRAFHANGRIDEDDNVYINAAIHRMALFGKDVTFDLSGEGKIYQDTSENYILNGIFLMRQIIFDGRPLDNIAIEYQISNNELIITSCQWENFFVAGKINLKSPFDVKLDVIISEMDLANFVTVLGIRDENLLLVGKILGLVHLERREDLFDITAQLHSWDGLIKEMEFKEADMKLEGIFPSFHFLDSWMVSEGNSYMNIEGYFDVTKLSDLKSPNHNVRIIPTEKKFKIFDWVVSAKEGETEALSLQKYISDDIILSMDSFRQGISDAQRFKNEDGIGIEYKMEKNQRLKMYLKEDEETVGWAQVHKF